MSQPNTGKRKVPGPNNIKKYQPKKEYSLSLKHNIKTATVSEICHSEEHVQQTNNKKRLIFDQNKNSSVFANPDDPNLTANGAYDHTDNQYGRYGYHHQADTQFDGNDYYHADNQYGRYGYHHQVYNQYGGNGCGHTDSQYGRYGYIIKLIINIAVMNIIIGLMISMVDVGVIKQIVKDIGSIDASVAIKGTIFMVMVATYIVNTSREIIRTTLTHSSQNKTNSLEGVV